MLTSEASEARQMSDRQAAISALSETLSDVEGGSRHPKDFDIAPVLVRYWALLSPTEDIDLNETASFLATASRLMLLKSRALIPHVKEENEELHELLDGDSRDTTAAKRFALLAERLRDPEFDARECFARVNHVSASDDVAKPAPADTRGLVTAMSRQMADYARRQAAHIAAPVYLRMEAAVRSLRRSLLQCGRLSFTGLVRGQALDRHGVVIHFLALLELLRRNEARARQIELFGDIVLETDRTEAREVG